MLLSKVISGGQTGADEAGLAAAKASGIPTGGTVPKGCRTDAGPNTDLITVYGCVESPYASYPPRTEDNVRDSDATIIFGDSSSPGGKLTQRLCKDYGKRVFRMEAVPNAVPEDLAAWLRYYRVTTLNVAGNRERTNPGIYQRTFEFLFETFRILREDTTAKK